MTPGRRSVPVNQTAPLQCHDCGRQLPAGFMKATKATGLFAGDTRRTPYLWSCKHCLDGDEYPAPQKPSPLRDFPCGYCSEMVPKDFMEDLDGTGVFDTRVMDIATPAAQEDVVAEVEFDLGRPHTEPDPNEWVVERDSPLLRIERLFACKHCLHGEKYPWEEDDPNVP